MSAILGGLFNSRLNMNLREDKGYTYGAGAGFDLRRGHGPFTARAAVNTEVTVPAIHEFLVELGRIREAPVTDAELKAARDYLVGVFPLRFETPGPVAGSLAGLFVHHLPDDELEHYRASIEAVTAADITRVAREHIHPEAAAVVLVGDHDAFGEELDAAAIGPVEVIREADPTAPAPDA
jgi:predicted Zn-dependent peptidase